jgi:hypothetical protein
MDRTKFISRLPEQYQRAIKKAPDLQRVELFNKIEEGFEIREIGSRGGFLLRKGSSFKNAEYCFVQRNGVAR